MALFGHRNRKDTELDNNASNVNNSYIYIVAQRVEMTDS
jgi:hypothetical protein